MAVTSPVTDKVAVGDYDSPAHYLKINADGSITVVEGATSNSATPTNISTSTTTQVKTGAGVLRSVVVNTKGTVASAVNIYDATAGTTNLIATIDSLNLSGTFVFNAAMATGIRVITTGAPNITVLWN